MIICSGSMKEISRASETKKVEDGRCEKPSLNEFPEPVWGSNFSIAHFKTKVLVYLFTINTLLAQLMKERAVIEGKFAGLMAVGRDASTYSLVVGRADDLLLLGDRETLVDTDSNTRG